jgi:hypothetical protein
VPGGFEPAVKWTTAPISPDRGLFFADKDGDKRADAITIENSYGFRNGTTGPIVPFEMMVRFSTGSAFRPFNRFGLNNWSERGIHFARVTNTQRDDLVMVREDGVWIYNSWSGVTYNATGDAFHGLR